MNNIHLHYSYGINTSHYGNLFNDSMYTNDRYYKTTKFRAVIPLQISGDNFRGCRTVFGHNGNTNTNTNEKIQNININSRSSERHFPTMITIGDQMQVNPGE